MLSQEHHAGTLGPQCLGLPCECTQIDVALCHQPTAAQHQTATFDLAADAPARQDQEQGGRRQHAALRAGHLIPILIVSAKTGAGVPQLLDTLAKLAPNPSEGNPPPFYKGEPGEQPQAFDAQPDDTLHVLAHVFKVTVDPYVGKLGLVRVHQGTLKPGMHVLQIAGDGAETLRVMVAGKP